MREIKFRGKRIDNGEWVYGDYLTHCKKVSRYISNAPFEFEVIPETVGQYTNHNINEDNEIYEGDIFDYNENYIVVVEWVLSGWQLVAYKKPSAKCSGGLHYQNLGYLESFDFEDIKKIGNIHDNPEFLLERRVL